ncbi:MAG: YCF48-related protein [Bacteroidota bacterium]
MLNPRIVVLSCFFFLCASAVFAQSGWTTIPSGTSGSFYEAGTISFSQQSPVTINYAAGDSGIVLRSVDGGKSWMKSIAGNGGRIYSMQYFYADTAFAVGDSGMIYRSSDSGATWQPVTGVPDSLALYSLVFPTAERFAGTRSAWAVGDGGKILRTITRGASWYELPSNTTASLRSICLTSLTRLYVCGDSGIILRTTTGGYSWNRVLPLPPENLYDIQATISNTGDLDLLWAVGEKGRILYSSNSGYSWLSEQSNVSQSLRKICIVGNAGTVYVAGDSGIVLRTDDFGATWRRISTGITSTLYGVSFADQYNGFVTGENGTILQTTFGGVYAPRFWTSCPSIDLGSCLIGESRQTSFVVSNIGTAPMHISSVSLIGSEWSGSFRAETLGVSQSVQYTLTYSPVSYGENYGGLQFYHDGSDSATTISLHGFGANKNEETNWNWVKPFPVPAALCNVRFTSPSTAYAVGDNGNIIKSTDGGTHWSASLNAGGNLNILRDIYFPSANTGVAVGANGTILHTSDAGVSWVSQQSGSAAWLTSVCFTDELNGTVVGQSGCSSNGPTILNTSDGGVTWAAKTVPSVSDLNVVRFFTPAVGVAAGPAGTIIRTTDGGDTWYNLPSVTGDDLLSLHLTDQNNGVIFGLDYLYREVNSAHLTLLKTTDAGATWMKEVIQFSSTDDVPVQLSFTDELNGIGINGSGTIFKTSDGGTLWTRGVQIPNIYPFIEYTIATSSSGKIIVAGGSIGGDLIADIYDTYEHDISAPVLYQSVDGGSTFNNLSGANSFCTLHALSYADINNGILVGDSASIYRTTDGGGTWVNQLSGTIMAAQGYAFGGATLIDAKNAYVTGSHSTIVHTTDGGISWNLEMTSGDDWLFKCVFADANHGYVMGNHSVLYTSDGGAHWTNQFSSALGTFRSIASPSPGNWFAIRYNRSILRTTDNGAHWDSVDTGTQRELYDVAFSSALNGIIVGHGIILHTSDGGNSWTTQLLDLKKYEFMDYGLNFTNVSMCKDGSGFAAGFYGLIVHTTDGGLTWNFQASGTGSACNGLEAFDSNHAVMLMQYSSLLQLGANGALGISRIPSPNVPTVFALAQNYPNPFNPATTIRFDIPVTANVSLTIFDLLGREVATLLDERKEPGYYEVKWNASNFASGVFFYRLQVDKFVQTRKLVFLK